MSVLAIVLRILSIVGTILGITQAIENKPVSQEGHPLQIQTAVLAIANYIIDPVVGLPKVLSNQSALLTAIGIAQNDILTAIANLTNGTTPVSLPPTPPTGYGGGSTAAEVWNYSIPAAQFTDAGFLLGMAGLTANKQVLIDSQIAGDVLPGWLVGSNWPIEQIGPDLTLPHIAPTTILATDATPVAWANRVYPLSIAYTADSLGRPVYPDQRSNTGYVYTIDMDILRFSQWKAALALVAQSAGAPVWPGIANVTLGSTLALADGLNIPGPLDGVILSITAVPSPISYYPFGPLRSYVHVGGLAFVDDNGQAETVQPIGLSANVVCPKAMNRASHAFLRLQSGVVGTITPWIHT